MKIDELNDKYYSLFSDLYRAQSFLPQKQFETMSTALYKDYVNELEVVVGEKQLEVGKFVFELRFKLKNYLPHRLFFWRWNKVAKAILKQLKADFVNDLAHMEKTLADTIQGPEQAEQTALQKIEVE